MSDIENVKKLREATGAGFKDCNLAIKEANGDLDKAIEILRVKGISKASKKMSRDAKEGVVVVSGNETKTSIIEVNCETDFVAKNQDFISFCKELSEISFLSKGNIEKLSSSKMKNGLSVKDSLVNLIAKIGENLILNDVIIKDNTTNENITDLPLEIIPISENKFRVMLPDGTQKFYLSESGDIYEISANNEIKSNQFSPVNTDLNNVKINNTSIAAFLCMFLILIFMIFDDFIGIRAIYRLIFQSSVVFLMIMMSEEYILNIGNLLNTGDIYLGNFAIPFTIFCVVGLMNAFNMIDGLNGICAAFALVPIIFITLFGNLSYGLLIPIGSILGFLAYNMGFLGKKRRVFLGDSGSNILGFLVAFLCIEYTQNSNNPYLLNPVTALWLVAIPLVDCINVMISRVMRGIGPFDPGRDHLHHKLLSFGIKPKKIFYIFIFQNINNNSFYFLLANIGRNWSACCL